MLFPVQTVGAAFFLAEGAFGRQTYDKVILNKPTHLFVFL